MATVFGLTGGIACGKSTVSDFFRSQGVAIVDADQVARDVVEPGTPGLIAVSSAFGASIRNVDGTLNRAVLGSIVFADVKQRRRLEEILWPYITARIETLVAESAKSHDLVCLDAALFFEFGLHEKYKPVVLVALTPEMQLERLMARNSLTREAAGQRIASQMSHEQRVAKLPADGFLLWNTGTVDELREGAKEVLRTIRSRR